MVQINFAQKTVNVKVVYYGPGMSGKTTNLEIVHQRAPDTNRGELTSISTDGDRTLFFDYMPLDLGTVAGMRTCFQLYTVPGQVYYNSTRKLVLQGVDGVIFVADSSASMTEQNLDSLRNLEENLNEYGKSLSQMPMVIQWNKRDLPDALPVEELERQVNSFKVPTFEAMANSGQGVFPTLKALAALVLKSIMNETGSGKPSFGSPAPAAPVAPVAPVAPAAPVDPVAPVAPVAGPPAVEPAAPHPGAPAAPAPAPVPLGSQGGLNPALAGGAVHAPSGGETHLAQPTLQPGLAAQPAPVSPSYAAPVPAPAAADPHAVAGLSTARRTPAAQPAGAPTHPTPKRRARRTQQQASVPAPSRHKGGGLTAVFVVVGVGLGAALAWFAMSVL